MRDRSFDPPETAVAHEEARIDARRAKLRRADPTRYGVWDKREIQGQDSIVATR